MSYLFLFLSSQKIMRITPVNLCSQIQQQLKHGQDLFEQVLAQTPVINQTQFTSAMRSTIAKKLAKATVWLVVFDYFDISQITSQDQAHIMINFPALTSLGDQLVDTSARTFNLQLSDRTRDGLLKSYVRILIDEVPSELVKDKVTICVDFIQTTVPMTYFADLLTANLGGGVILTDHLSGDVDIYLSDIFVSSIHNIPQVTWFDPLRSSNWDKLRQKIAEVKQSKLARFSSAS